MDGINEVSFEDTLKENNNKMNKLIMSLISFDVMLIYTRDREKERKRDRERDL